jgi:eukaryotic-like serine/threonine-protein kinase
MNDLASIYLAGGKYAQAEATYTKVLELRRRVIGEEHPNTVDTLAALGHARLLEQKYADAEPVLRSALNAYLKARPETWERYSCESMLGASLAGQRNFAEGEPLLLSGYEGMSRRQANIPVPDRANLRDAEERVLQLYKDWGRSEKVVEWRAKLKAARDQSVARP